MQLAPQTLVLGGHEYSIGRLDVFDAMHVTRLISPFAPVLIGTVFSQIQSLVAKSKEEGGASAEDFLSEVGSLVSACEPFLYRLAMLDRKSFEDIVKTCLSCVERRTGKIFGRVIVEGNLMFSDMTTVEITRLTIAVIVRELRPIFAALDKSASGAA